VAVGFLAWTSARAERLPFKIYTTSDGLAHDGINKIVRDSRGFLWFCTADGLSRFNGYNFKTYTQEQGLPSRNVMDLLETRDGTYLIATSGGMAVFDPLGRAYRWNVIQGKLEQNGSEPPMFRTINPPEDPTNKSSQAIYSLAQRGDGTIYAGTNQGLFRFVETRGGGELRLVESPLLPLSGTLYGGLFVDTRRGMWIVTSSGIFRMTGEARIDKIAEIGGREIFEDRDERIWIGSSGIDLGLRIFSFQGDVPQLTQTFTVKDGLKMNMFARAVVQVDDGRVLITSGGALGEYLPEAKAGTPRFRYFDSELVGPGALDTGGNLWLGTAGRGAWKLSLNGFVSYGPEDGMPGDAVGSMFVTPDGDVFTTIQDDRLNHLAGEKIERIKPLGFQPRTWGSTFLDFRSADGEWWLPSRNGLFRYPAVRDVRELAHTPPKKVYTQSDGLMNNQVFNLFEDSRRDVWISAVSGPNSLQRWDRATDKIVKYTTADGLKSTNGGAVSFGEDATGNVWIGFYYGGAVRYRHGQFQAFGAADGIPEGYISDFLTDAKGRLWIATISRGLFRVDDPDSDTPKFTSFSMTQGLLSNEVSCLALDKFGRIYAGTGRGLNRIDPESLALRAYTQVDGLPGNYVSQCRTDRNGVLWVAGANSIARFVPGPEKPSVPPPVYIDGISINGTSHRVSELGETKIENLALAADQRQVEIDFFALSFEAGGTLHYQYKLNDQNWSAPTDQRSIALNLTAGSYQFAVRAVTSDGVMSTAPATVSFTIAQPFWQRWWFLSGIGLLIGTVLFAFYRSRERKTREVQRAREERLTELQRVRTRIATDLHDDIGSSLSQIAIYSEVARQRDGQDGPASEPLDLIYNVSNELVDTMSDIVWAINPTKDHLRDLTQRMRRFAGNVLTAKDIDHEFHAPEAEQDIPLGANIRREVFLIFKETVNNIVVHAAAKNVEIVFRLEEHALEISFRDDGVGFSLADDPRLSGDHDWSRIRGGNGLVNMKKRAADLNGTYEIDSVVGQGTTVVLRVPFEASKVQLQTTP
jgi:signal transduction histidine kinase/ligand-binding sensor domain-containing protein